MNAQNQFLNWLRHNGAEVLAPTNPYEYARFIARGGTHVIYQGRRGITANGFAQECLIAFEQGKPLHMGFAKKGSSHARRWAAALMERDGDGCFFCRKPLAGDITIEHLVSRQKGGPDHQDNLALAHQRCNQDASHLPLVEKIKIRERAL